MNPWDQTDVWKNESQYLTWLRGHLRKSLWQHYPPKITFKNERCVPATPEMKEKYGLHRSCKYTGSCEFCDQYFPKSKLEVDHVVECGALTMTNKSEWIDRLLCDKANMRLLCKPCHKIHTYAERMGISFVEATIEKKVIEFSKKPVKMQKELLEKFGHKSNNATVRKNGYRLYLQSEIA